MQQGCDCSHSCQLLKKPGSRPQVFMLATRNSTYRGGHGRNPFTIATVRRLAQIFDNPKPGGPLTNRQPTEIFVDSVYVTPQPDTSELGKGVKKL